jgi:hypothetical protein
MQSFEVRLVESWWGLHRVAEVCTLAEAMFQAERSPGFLFQVSESYRFGLPLSVRLVNTILTKTSGDT